MWPQGPGVGPCTKPSISGLETGQLGPLGGPVVGGCCCSYRRAGSRSGAQTVPVGFPSPPSSFPPPAEFPRPSPAELPGVIHVWACLNVPFLGVVDRGGSGIRPTQDEHEAIERDRGSVLVVCKESRAGRSGHLFSATPSPPLPSPERPPEDGLWQRMAPPSAVNRLEDKAWAQGAAGTRSSLPVAQASGVCGSAQPGGLSPPPSPQTGVCRTTGLSGPSGLGALR